jgi:hypothetical protein
LALQVDYLFFLLFELLLLFGNQLTVIDNLLFLFGELPPEPLVFALQAIVAQGKRFATGWRITARTAAGPRMTVQTPTHATTVIENLRHVQRHAEGGYLNCYGFVACIGFVEKKSGNLFNNFLSFLKAVSFFLLGGS